MRRNTDTRQRVQMVSRWWIFREIAMEIRTMKKKLRTTNYSSWLFLLLLVIGMWFFFSVVSNNLTSFFYPKTLIWENIGKSDLPRPESLKWRYRIFLPLGPQNGTVEFIHQDDDIWIDVWRKNFQNYLTYSAFFKKGVGGENSQVFILALAPTDVADTMRLAPCVVRNDTSQNGTIVPTLASVFTTDKVNDSFVAVQFMCTVHQKTAPVEATLYVNKVVQKWIPVHSPQARVYPDIKKNPVAVCVRSTTIETGEMVSRFLSHYVAFQVNHFTFYARNISDDALRVLRSVSEKTSIEIDILPWNTSIHKNNSSCSEQLCLLQDCILRHTSRFQWVFNVRIDEYVSTTRHKNFGNLLGKLENSTGAYFLKQADGCQENGDKTDVGSNKKQSVAALLRPEAMGLVGIHGLRAISSGYTVKNLLSEDLSMYHFRSCFPKPEAVPSASDILQNNELPDVLQEQKRLSGQTHFMRTDTYNALCS